MKFKAIYWLLLIGMYWTSLALVQNRNPAYGGKITCGNKGKAPYETCQSIDPPEIYIAKCATCHHPDYPGTGPALRGIMDRAPYESWFKEYVRNEDSLLSIGDSSALAVQSYNENRFNYRHRIIELTEEQLDEIIAFLRED